MKFVQVVWGALLSMALCASLAVQAAPLYKVTVVGRADSVVYGINSTGQVVGQLAAGTERHAFYFDGATLNDLGTLGGANSIAWAINDSGTVVGSADTADALRAFTYHGGALTALPEDLWVARDINQAGAITGSGRVEGYFSNAYIYANGVATFLGGLPSTDEEGSAGIGINNAGKVVGEAIVGGAPNRPTQPFLYSGGVMQDLGNFGGIFSDARAINDHDQVVGAAGGPYLNDGNLYPAKAFLWEDGVMRMLGEFSPNGNSFANDINNLGQIVGTARSAQADLAFLYQGGSMVPLDALIDPASGWTITDANGINELQQIAATACKLGVCYAVRLDPTAAIPEPAHWLMLGAGLLALLSRARAVPAVMREAGRRAWQLRTLS